MGRKIVSQPETGSEGWREGRRQNHMEQTKVPQEGPDFTTTFVFLEVPLNLS